VKRFIVAALVAALSFIGGPASAQTFEGGTPQVHKFTLTPASPTACTTLGVGPGVLQSIISTGPALSVYLVLYDDTKCTNPAAAVFGDGSTVTFTSAATTFPIDVILNTGLSYTLSGSLSSFQNIVLTYTGLGT
jgi:hypothetical protein